MVGAVLIALWAVAWLASSWNRVNDYSWRSGSTIYLANGGREATQCTVTPPDGAAPQPVHLAAYQPLLFSVNKYVIRGAKVDRTFAGTALVSCDHPFSVVRGWPLRLLPIGYTGYPFMLGVVLVALWRVAGGSGRRRWLPGAWPPSVPSA